MMSKSNRTALFAASSAAALLMTIAPAAVAQDADTADGGALETIVTVGTATGRSQIESAVAVTNVSYETIDQFQPTSEAEILRLLPGIQVSGTVGPGGNANIAVRGLPVATGGAPFVQIQEDGLPTVLFGDIQFGNNDYWTNFDATVQSVDALRGGSSGTFASQAPGAVINYISRTGEEEGGFVKLTTGLGFDEQQLDFRLGGPLSDTVRYHVGGFFRTGEGPLESGFKVTESLQLKGNITKDFDDGTGFFRLNFKLADTQEPNYTGAPFTFDDDGSTVSDFGAFEGFDGLDQSAYSALNQSMLVYQPDGFSRVPLDGITTEQLAVGFEFDREVSSNFTVNNKFRWSDISGAFANPFFGLARTDSVIGSDLSINGEAYATVSEIRYANGPRAGEVFTDTYLDNNAIFRTDIEDLGSFVNDLRVTGEFETGFGYLNALVGYFYMDQSIATNWKINRGNREVSGANAAALDLYDSAGNLLSHAGISGYGNNWGNCCARDYDLNYVNQAPYVALELDNERFNIDASVRQDTIKASGFNIGGGSEFFVDPNGAVVGTSAADYVPGAGFITAMLPNGTQEILDYDVDYTSYTVGGLFKLDGDTSVFARVGKGNRFNADRQTNAGNFNGDGSLTEAGETSAVDEVNQFELGLKRRGDLFDGFYSVELTYLMGDFSQNTFEIDGTGTRCPDGANTCVLSTEFESQGFEFYGTYSLGGLSLLSTLTYTDAERKGSTDPDFSRAERIPEFTYALAASYALNEALSGGVNVTGQTNVLNAGREWDGGNTVNGFVEYRPFENIGLGVDVYNLFDEINLREGGAIVDSSVNPVIGTASTTIGRTVRASVKYDF